MIFVHWQTCPGNPSNDIIMPDELVTAGWPIRPYKCPDTCCLAIRSPYHPWSFQTSLRVPGWKLPGRRMSKPQIQNYVILCSSDDNQFLLQRETQSKLSQCANLTLSLSIYIHVRRYVYLHTYTLVYIYINTPVYIYVYIYAYIYTYTPVFWLYYDLFPDIDQNKDNHMVDVGKRSSSKQIRYHDT